MGLAERKVKQRIGHDPRNLSWSGDTNRFSYKHMTALGWNDSKGLGQSGDGNPNHIAVVHKLDNGGIGMNRARKEGEDNAAGAGQAGRGLEDVLKRLAAASASPSPAPESPAEASASDKELKKRNKIASRQRHLASKRLASSSPAALAEILGVPVASLPASPSPSAPATPANSSPEPAEASPDPDTERTADEPVKKSTLSVTDYFRQKMREKMLARQAAAGGEEVPTMPEGSLAVVKEENKKAIGGVAWEGSKVEFKEEVVELADLGAEAGPSVKVEEGVEAKVEEGEVDEKAAKRARKEEKRLKKLAAEVKREDDVKPTEAEIVAAGVESEEVKAKREKRERKEEKKRLKEAVSETIKVDKKKRKRDDHDGEGKASKKDKKDKERKGKE